MTDEREIPEHLKDDAHEAHIRNETINPFCDRCMAEAKEAFTPDEFDKLEALKPELLEKVNRSLQRDDVQPFETLRRLGAIEVTKVWHRYFSGDFMAETTVRLPGRKRHRTLQATGDGLEDALYNLATVVADTLNPAKEGAA